MEKTELEIFVKKKVYAVNCPFCGSGVGFTWADYGEQKVQVVCPCGVSGPKGKDELMAVYNWNKLFGVLSVEE